MPKTFDGRLLPCPYCGGERKPVKGPPFYAECLNDECQHFSPNRNTEAEAIEIANRGCWRIVERDGLPDTVGPWLITSAVTKGITAAIFQDGKFWSIEDGAQFTDPPAWMPLPEPAKVADNETGSE